MSTTTTEIMCITGPAPPISDPDLICTSGGTNALDPTTEPCPLFTATPWPIECPIATTYSLMQNASAQAVAEGNRYRKDRGMSTLAWNDNLAAAALWHATYLKLNIATVGPTHDEPAEDFKNYTPAARADTQLYRGGSVAEIIFDGTEFVGTLNPTVAFCQIKDTYVDETNPNMFYPFVSTADPQTVSRTDIGIAWSNGIYVFLLGSGGTVAGPPTQPWVIDETLSCNVENPPGTSDVLNPKTEPCPAFDGIGWPVECPTVLTYELLRTATLQAVAEGNRYRTSRGLGELTFNDNLAAAAMWQATYIKENNPVPKLSGINVHDSPGGTHGATLKERITNAGYDAEYYAEGVAMKDAYLCDSLDPVQAFCTFKENYVNDDTPSSFFPYTGANSETVKSFTDIGIGNRCGVWVYVYAGNNKTTPVTAPPAIEDAALTCTETETEGLDPTTEPCPAFDGIGWPLECPVPRTFENTQLAFAQTLAEANRYRTARGHTALAWDPNLVAAAQWHATYLEKHNVLNGTDAEISGYEYFKATTGNDRAILANYVGGTVSTIVYTGNMKQNPISAFCEIKNTYVSVKEPGSFGPYTLLPAIKRIGIGFSKIGISNETVFVFVYGAVPEDGIFSTGPPPADSLTKDPLLTCPVVTRDSGLPGIGDGTVVKYDPLYLTGTVYPGSKDYNPASTDPKTRGCPPYNVTGYPQICPQKRTWEYVERIFQPVLDEGNVYRTAKGMPGLIFDRWLALAAQRHATYLAENWDYLYKNPTGLLYIQHKSLLAAHYEQRPPIASFGENVGDRVRNTGRENLFTAEGIGFGSRSPMEGLCNQKADYVSDANPGHFGPWYTDNNQKYVGWGIDRAVNNGWVIQVFVYSTREAGTGSTPLNELWTYLPKFGCLDPIPPCTPSVDEVVYRPAKPETLAEPSAYQFDTRVENTKIPKGYLWSIEMASYPFNFYGPMGFQQFYPGSVLANNNPANVILYHYRAGGPLQARWDSIAVTGPTLVVPPNPDPAFYTNTHWNRVYDTKWRTVFGGANYNNTRYQSPPYAEGYRYIDIFTRPPMTGFNNGSVQSPTALTTNYNTTIHYKAAYTLDQTMEDTYMFYFRTTRRLPAAVLTATTAAELNTASGTTLFTPWTAADVTQFRSWALANSTVTNKYFTGPEVSYSPATPEVPAVPGVTGNCPVVNVPTGQMTPRATRVTTNAGGAKMISDSVLLSQLAPKVFSQAPSGVGFIHPTDWAAATWNGVPPDPTGKTKEELCAFIRPGESPHAILGLKQKFEQVQPFADEENPTVAEIDDWNLEVIRHFRALFGNTTPVNHDPRLYLEARWASERKYTTAWDAEYPLDCDGGTTKGGPCGPCWPGPVDTTGGHCGAAFFPNDTHRQNAVNATPYSADFVTYPELKGYTARRSAAEGVSGVAADVPWSLKLAFIIANWICDEGMTGHPGPYVGTNARQYFGSAWWFVPPNGMAYRGKWA